MKNGSRMGWAIALCCGAIAVPTASIHASTPLPLRYAHEGHSHGEPHGAGSFHPHSPHSPHHHSGEGDHEHGKLEIPAGQLVPTVDLVVHPDARRGWNLEIRVTNFTFAPERVNQASNFQEGHGHLYIDGVKITRLYGTWYYLESLAPGTHEITVSLNANGHEALMHNGQPIQATRRIMVQP
ncbi:MAG: hypothetical protein SNJ57_13590 [Cyanobacteriota bacterium]